MAFRIHLGGYNLWFKALTVLTSLYWGIYPSHTPHSNLVGLVAHVDFIYFDKISAAKFTRTSAFLVLTQIKPPLINFQYALRMYKYLILVYMYVSTTNTTCSRVGGISLQLGPKVSYHREAVDTFPHSSLDSREISWTFPVCHYVESYGYL